MKFCPYCGKENPGDYNYCGQCQKPLPGIERTVQPRIERQEVPPPPPPRQVHYERPSSHNYAPHQPIITEEDKHLAEKYSLYGYIWGLLGLVIFFPLSIGGIYYGSKAKKIDPSKGGGAIAFGVISFIVGLLLTLILVSMMIGF